MTKIGKNLHRVDVSITRPFWIQKIEELWKKRPIVWLQGPRRTGKTTLAKSIQNAIYFNCDLPKVQRLLDDPEEFLAGQTNKIVFDEIHQLKNPSLILKIAADEFKHLKILATGSSTLFASDKFKDTLTDRKRNLVFPPVLALELGAFGIKKLDDRLLFGGCPAALLNGQPDPEFYSEWFDSFYSRDIQKVFQVDKRQPFTDTLRFLMNQNGHLLDVSHLSKEVGISRPTAVRYLEILSQAQSIRILKPWAQKDDREYRNMPKTYGFDTGFVCFAKGLDTIRPDDRGNLLENLTLDTLMAFNRTDQIYYWRTKDGFEIDMIVTDGQQFHTFEVKAKRTEFSVKSLKKFRDLYPLGNNYLVTGEFDSKQTVNIQGMKVKIASVTRLHEFFNFT